MLKITVKILTVLTVISLSGCVAAPLVITGLGATGVAVQETTGKGLADHAVSTVRDKDCRLSRSLKREDICQDEIPPFKFSVTTTSVAPSSIEEIESRYH